MGFKEYISEYTNNHLVEANKKVARKLNEAMGLVEEAFEICEDEKMKYEISKANDILEALWKKNK